MKSYSLLKIIGAFLLFATISTSIWGQNTYYIDPLLGSPSNTGLTPSDPFDDFPSLMIADDIYLMKCGETLTLTSPLSISTSNITIGYYDVGSNPIIQCSSITSVIDISNVSNINIHNIQIQGTNPSITEKGININGTSGTSITNVFIENCQIDDVETGIYAAYVDNLCIENCDITSFFRCIDISYAESTEISKCTILLDYDSNVTGDKYGILINYSTFDIMSNMIQSTYPVIGILFFAHHALGNYNDFYNNTCIGTRFIISCIKIGIGMTEIYNNRLEGAQNGVINEDVFYHEIAKIHHNIISNCTENGIHFSSNNQIIYSIHIYHNVIYAGSNDIDYTAIKLGIAWNGGTSAHIKNNILYLENQVGRVYDIPTFGTSTINYNRLPANFPGFIRFAGTNLNTLASFQGFPNYYANDSEAYMSSSTSPLGSSPFISANPYNAIDFSLLPSSNCIDVGCIIPNIPPSSAFIFLNIDYFGNYIPAGIPSGNSTGIDIGAIEYYPPEESDFVNNPPTGWYFATEDIIDADYDNNSFTHKKGNIYHDEELVYLRGVNLWGIESNSISDLSLDDYGIDDLLNKIKSLGYNTIRLCYTVDVIIDQMNSTSNTIPLSSVDETLTGNSIFFSAPNTPKTIYEAIIAIIDRCNDPSINLNVVLSHHGIEDPAGNDIIGLWYSTTNNVTEVDYLESLFYLAENLTQDNIVGISLINEPFEAKWDGSGDTDDFRHFAHTAGQNIRAINPDWLVFVEGVKDHGCIAKKDEEVLLSEYTSTSLGTTNNSSDSYGNAESLATYGENSNSSSTSYYPVDPNSIPYHKLVFSPHTTQFEEYFVIDSLHYNESNITDINDFRWGYLTKDNAVIPGEFGAFYQTENTGITFVEQAEYAEEWFDFFVEYIAERKLPGSFYWAINGNTEDCVIDNTSTEYCYEQSLVEPLDWMQEKTDKIEDYAIMFGQVEEDIDPSASNVLYSPRDGTSYDFPSSCFSSNTTIKHTAHWAGEDYLTTGNPDYVEYASDVLSAKDDFGHLVSILHEFKVIDQNSNPILPAADDFTITVEYTDNELGWVSEYFLNFYKYNSTTSEWNIATGTISLDTDENEIILTTDEFGIYAVLGYGQTTTQTINLVAGWSIISSYINPDLPDMDDIFAGLSYCEGEGIPSGCELIIVKNGAGQIYWPYYSLNLIGNWDFSDGYQVKMSIPAILDITGVKLIPELDASQIFIPQGWDIISYLRTTPANIETMFSSIASDIEIVKNDIGQVYWPAWGINGIGDMIPGEGYQFDMLVQHYWNYPQNLPGTKQGSYKASQVEFIFKNYIQDLYINTDNNMVIGIPENAWQITPLVGDEIAVFGENGQLVGKTIFPGGFTAITIYGDDYYTPNIVENLAGGESFSFEVWSATNKTVKSYKFQKWLNGDGTFINDGIDIVAIENIEEQEPVFEMDVFPNPGNGLFWIEIYSTQQLQFELEVINLNGKIVLFKDFLMVEGYYKQMLDLSYLKDGIYTLNLKSKETREQTKLVIIQ